MAARIPRQTANQDRSEPDIVEPKTLAALALADVANLVHPIVPCVAGGVNMPLIEAVSVVGLTPVFPKSELGAGGIANGLAWQSGLPVLCIVITSAGMYGLIQALYAASVNRRPVVLISGEVAAVGKGSVQAGDGWDGPSVTAVTRNLTCWSVDAWTADLARRAVSRGVLLARQELRPVHINVPLSVQKELVK